MRADAAALSPAAIVLQESDVPSGFHPVFADFLTNADITKRNHMSVAALLRMGRDLGYEVKFSRETTKGMCCIYNEVIRWTSNRTAEKGYQWISKAYRDVYGKYPGSQDFRNKAGTLEVLSFPCNCAGRDEIVDMLTTYKANYTVYLEVHFVEGTADPRVMLRGASRMVRVVVSRIP
jgi:hypothetical protein